ncbi:MAG: alpha/beta fold hydrolase, partial [Myxococcales bacterium]|nr:alpha/beta fold hydrolase [Myxococcales bacterium]
MSVTAIIESHERAGRYFDVAGVRGFVREAGSGAPVLCLHGVPASSFLYRKVITELADRGLRALAIDLPGLGLSDRPVHFDYSWTGLGRFCVGAVDALGLERFHLVVHDVGGPVGFELARAMPERIVSLTVLNTVVDVDVFRRPWQMKPFAAPLLGELWLAMMQPITVRSLFYHAGIKDRSSMTRDE